MQRDLDLVRDLLQILEDPQKAYSDRTYGLSVWSPRVQYHLQLMVEAELASGYGYAMNGATSLRLTWRGHELLEMSRDANIWNRAVRAVKTETGGCCLDTLVQVLRQWHHQQSAKAQTWLPQGTASQPKLRSAVHRWPKLKPEVSEPVRVETPGLATVGFQMHVGRFEDQLPLYLL